MLRTNHRLAQPRCCFRPINGKTFCSYMRDDPVVDVVSAETGVPVRRQNFENSVV